MYRNLDMRTLTGVRSVQTRLTEENLRQHSSAHIKNRSDSACELEEKPTWVSVPESYPQFDDDFDGSDDGDMDTRRHQIAMRRAASLEALKAYGGCFASGFLAMQEPLPWTSKSNGNTTELLCQDVEGRDLQRLVSEMTSIDTGSVKTASSTSYSNFGSPRPDSDTLSQADITSLRSERKWSWRNLGKRRRGVESWLKM